MLREPVYQCVTFVRSQTRLPTLLAAFIVCLCLAPSSKIEFIAFQHIISHFDTSSLYGICPEIIHLRDIGRKKVKETTSLYYFKAD